MNTQELIQAIQDKKAEYETLLQRGVNNVATVALRELKDLQTALAFEQINLAMAVE